MPGEEIHPPLPSNDAAQAIVPAAEIHRLNCEIDPNTRRKREQRLSQPANELGYVGRIAAFFEAKPKAGAQLNLQLLGRGAAETHRQQSQRVTLRRPARWRLVEVVFQGSVGHAMLGCDLCAWDPALPGLCDGGRPELGFAG